jgi:hypothetical protein
MNPELQALYILGTVAVTATVARVGLESRIRFIDWLALGSVLLMLVQITSMIAAGKF